MLLNLDPLNETQLQRLGPAAVPQLVAHLTHPRGDCRRALYALQYCWSDAAVGHVAALLTATSSELRRMAAIVLDRQVGREQLARLCAQHVEHPDAAVAGFCLEHAEVMLPAVDRAAYALQRPVLWPRIARYLPRYQTTQLTAATRALLGAVTDLVSCWISEPHGMAPFFQFE